MPETGAVSEAHRTLVRCGACRQRLTGRVSTFRQALGLVSGLAPLLYPAREDPHLSPPCLAAAGTYPYDGVLVSDSLDRLSPIREAPLR